jgi:hypothetical protein
MIAVSRQEQEASFTEKIPRKEEKAGLSSDLGFPDYASL